MSHDSAAIFVSHGLGPTGMIEVAVSQQKVFELHIWFQAFGNVFYQLRVISTTSGINKGCFVAEAYEVDGGVRGISQPPSAHLPEIIPDSCAHSDPLFVRCKYAIRFAADHAEYQRLARLHGYLLHCYPSTSFGHMFQPFFDTDIRETVSMTFSKPYLSIMDSSPISTSSNLTSSSTSSSLSS